MDTVILEPVTESQKGTSFKNMDVDSTAGGVNERLYRKYGDLRTRLVDEPVEYEFTGDHALMHQYYRLRVDVYRQKMGLKFFSYEPDEHDRISHTLIVRKGKLCVGGVRLTVREPDEKWLLPMENDDFRLKERLPQLNLHTHRHAEVSRFAIMEDYNNKEMLYQLSTRLMLKSAELGVHYGFCRSPLLLARNWRKIANSVDGFSGEIIEDLVLPVIPVHEDMKIYLLMFKNKRLLEAGSAPHVTSAPLLVLEDH